MLCGNFEQNCGAFPTDFFKILLEGGVTFLSAKIEAAVLTEPYSPLCCFVTTHFPAVTAT